MSAGALSLLADAVLALHVAVVLFVVGGLVLVIAGNRAGWRWVNHWWLRLAHLAAIAYVAAQAWWGLECPLTTLEIWLRRQAGETAYGASFVAHWLQRRCTRLGVHTGLHAVRAGRGRRLVALPAAAGRQTLRRQGTHIRRAL